MTLTAERMGMPLPSPHEAVRSVPRAFQGILISYVLLTGELAKGLQAALFGMQGGGEAAFTAATFLAIATDIVRVAPVFMYARHPLGILHPLILTTILWPLLVAMPGQIDELFGLGGLLVGETVTPPFYSGLGWLPGTIIWPAVAWANLCELLALLSTYAGFALAGSREHARDMARRSASRKEFDGQKLRLLAIAVIGISVTFLLVLIAFRGGLAAHLADMARGRFRSMAGLGPLVAAVDLGLIALIVWAAARPADAKKPLFIFLIVAVAAAQFISNGARSSAFVVFLCVGIAWALRTRQIPWRLAAIMAPVLFLSFGALNIVRTAGWTGETATQAIQGAGAGDVISRVQEEIEVRRSLESTVPVIWQGHEVMGGPLLGSTYGAAVFAVVPRWVWPDKPRGAGSLYAQSFLSEVREGLAVPVNPTTEEYWNFGILGVIVMSVLYGALIRHAHNFYIRRQENPFAVAAFVIFVTTFHFSTDDLVLFQQQMILLLFVLGLATVFASRFRSVADYPTPAQPQQQRSLGGPLPLR